MILAGVAIAVLCILVVLGMPILISLAGAIIFYLSVTGGWPMSLPQQIIGGMNDFILLAMPLFILAGGIMNAGGITARLIDFAVSLVGFMRGGLAHVNVATSVMFGGMIGTSVADLAATGSVIIPAMKEQKYPADFSAALSASSSGIGPLIPPSSPMILYSAATGTSLGALFLAGLVPGLILGLILMLIVAYLARRNGWQRMGAFSTKAVLRSGLRALLPLGLPVIILGGLVFGVFTPTEAGAFAVAYALLLAGPLYRRLTFPGLYRVAIDAAILTGEIILIVGLSTALGWALSNARVPLILASAIDTIVILDSQTLRIMAMVALAILAGMILDPLIPVIMPIILPTLIQFDIDLIHFGVLMVIAVVIGQVTPPVAIALVVASKIANEDLARVIRANTPFLLGLVVFLMVIILVPELATWLPEALKQ